MQFTETNIDIGNINILINILYIANQYIDLYMILYRKTTQINPNSPKTNPNKPKINPNSP